MCQRDENGLLVRITVDDVRKAEKECQNRYQYLRTNAR